MTEATRKLPRELGSSAIVSMHGRFGRRIDMATVGIARSKDACPRSANILPAAGGALLDDSRRPPKRARTGSGFSRRRFCRIFPNGDVWMLRVERGGWEMTAGPQDQKTFTTLSAAISYAVANDFSYRVVHALGNKNTGETSAAGSIAPRERPRAWTKCGLEQGSKRCCGTRLSPRAQSTVTAVSLPAVGVGDRPSEENLRGGY